MRILSPFSRKEEVLPLIDSGANELYCGIVPQEWEDRYAILDTLNRREGHGSNFSSFTDLQYAIQLAHNRNVPVFVTMNGLYTREQYSLIQKIIKKLKDIKVDGLIIADLGLLLLLQKLKFFKEIHIGAGGTTFNSRTVGFYKKLGATRIILDRHLTIDEIKDISRKSSFIMDLEVFILNTLCPNIDGFCTYYHGLSVVGKEIAPDVNIKKTKIKFFNSYDVSYGGHGCGLRFSTHVFDRFNNKIRRKAVVFTQKYSWKNIKECGVCALYDFSKIKIKILKIVERSAPIESKIKDTEFIKKSLSILNREKNISRGRFIRIAQRLYCDTYKCNECSGLHCYYPSVFINKH